MTSIPMTIATTSLAFSAALLSPVPTTSGIDQSPYAETPQGLISYVDGYGYSTSSAKTAEYERSHDAKFAAYEMFGQMRNSTLEERELYGQMLARKSTPIGVDIFAL